MTEMNKLQTVICNIGKAKVARACGLHPSNITRWLKNGKLPDTEYLPAKHPSRSQYALAISKLAKCKREELL